MYDIISASGIETKSGPTTVAKANRMNLPVLSYKYEQRRAPWVETLGRRTRYDFFIPPL